MGLPCGVFDTKYEKRLAVVRTKSQWLLLSLALAVFYTLHLYAPRDWVAWATMVGIVIVAVMGLHILTGLCGQFSMGHSAFMAVGAYATAMLGANAGFSAWATLPFAVLFAGVFGLLFAIPALRIKGFYLVMSTIAAQFIVTFALNNYASWSGGPMGIDVPAIEIFGGPITRNGFWLLTLSFVVVATFLAKNIQRTAKGRDFIAVRDNDLAAEVMGINLFRTKLTAFFISSCFAGVAGWLWAYRFSRVMPAMFTFENSVMYLGMIIVGGMGSTTGVIFGVISVRLVIKLVEYVAPMLIDAFPSLGVQSASAMATAAFAIVVILFIHLEPQGLYQLWQKFKLRYRLYPFAF